MSSKFLICALVCALTISVSADAATPELAKAAPSANVPSKQVLVSPVPLMWKVSDSDNDLYLLGSFHMLKPDDYPLAKDIDVAFDDAEAMVFELSPEEANSSTLGMTMAQAALRIDGKSLDSELPAPLATMLQEWSDSNSQPLEAMGMKPASLQMFEPWFVGLMISIVELKKFGLNSEIGLDNHFMGRAAQAGKPATGLELGSEQIALFDIMGRTEQLQFLEESLNDAEEAQTEIETLHDAWRRGDDVTLFNNMATEMREKYPQLYQSINVDRNDAWVPKLQRMLDNESDKDTLVVVGALHLLGSDGVVEKLRAKGYRVQRICSECRPSVPSAEQPKSRDSKL